MAGVYFTTFLSFLIVGLGTYTAAGLIITVSEKGQDVPDCIQTRPCKTLSFVAQMVSGRGKNISVILKDISFLDASFEGIVNLSIKNVGKEVKVAKNQGLSFTNVSDLFIELNSVSGGGKKCKEDQYVFLCIERCKNVVLKHTTFKNTKETSLLLVDTHGNINLSYVRFEYKKNHESRLQNESHSAVEIVFTDGNLSANYQVFHCMFTKNSAPQRFNLYGTTLRENSEWRGNSIGGGLSIFFKGNSSRKKISISECQFSRNKANWGGGMHIIFQDQSFDNSIDVSHSNFSNNQANEGGAGACIRFFTSKSQVSTDKKKMFNTVLFNHTTFLENNSKFGSGLTIFSTYSKYPSTSKIMLHQCEWRNNTGHYSSAVYIVPALFQRENNGHLPIPEFFDSKVINNSLITKRDHETLPYTFTTFSGIFVVTQTKVYFSGETRFLNNSNTAMYINSGTIVLKQRSHTVFANNKGSRGGAIAAYGYSSILVNKNSSLLFRNNTASELGGAIYYHPFEQLEFMHGRLCFLRHEELFENDTESISVVFESNNADVTGKSIYSSTLFPCHFWKKHATTEGNIKNDVLDFLGNVSFSDQLNPISTGPRCINKIMFKSEYKVIPGQLLSLPLDLTNEFGQRQPNVFPFRVKMINRRIIIDQQFTIDGTMKLSGEPGQNDILEVAHQAPRKSILHVNVTLLSCPPGFYYSSNTSTCKCSSDNIAYSYYGLPACNNDNFFAYISKGFWVGYIPTGNNYSSNLYTAICPLDFCKTVKDLGGAGNNLSGHICSANRFDILCGTCRENHSSFFHSENFVCGSNALCSYYGFPFFILSELVPITLLFTIIIVFKFSFTSGNINGFIFYSQVLSSLLVHANNANEQLDKLILPSKLIYGIFNFNYFTIPSLSYCLWKNATVMDMLAFKYVTIAFAFLLVFCLVMIMRNARCIKCLSQRRVSIINGISAFLMICSAQCAVTSFYILTPIYPRTQGGAIGDMVTFFGGMPYLMGLHRIYFILAILCILTVVVPFPLLLLLYPLTLHLLALCHLSEHWTVNKLQSILMINRMKPLIDSFQGCYKDKLRFFSGLYFVYRIVIFACFCFAQSTSQFHVLSQFLLCLFLAVHSIMQPYKKRSHNFIDSFIFLILIGINTCTIFVGHYDIHARETKFYGSSSVKTLFLIVRLILVYLPMIIYIIWSGIVALKSCLVLLPRKEKTAADSINEYDLDCLEYHQLKYVK